MIESRQFLNLLAERNGDRILRPLPYFYNNIIVLIDIHIMYVWSFIRACKMENM